MLSKAKLCFKRKYLEESVEIYKTMSEDNAELSGKINFLKSPFEPNSLIENLFKINLLEVSILQSNKVKCNFCNKMFARSRMVQHIGQHIVRKDSKIEENHNTCGYCGKSGNCSISIVTNNKTDSPYSKCTNFYKFSIVAASHSSKTSPCTNRPVKCNICSEINWTFNMTIHYKTFHPTCNSTEFITLSEIAVLKETPIV